MTKYDDEFASPPRHNRRDPITGKTLPSNTATTYSTASTYSRSRSSTSNIKPNIQTNTQARSQATNQTSRRSRATSDLSHDTESEYSRTSEKAAQSSQRKSSSSQKTLLMRGIDYLSRRDHSAYELRAKLAPYAESEDELELTIERLQKENWQNDERFMRNFTQAKQGRWGSTKLLHELQRHQLDSESLDEVREQLRETEYDRALEVYQRKFRTSLSAADDYQREYAKRVRFMMSRGFNAEVVRKVLKAPYPDE